MKKPCPKSETGRHLWVGRSPRRRPTTNPNGLVMYVRPIIYICDLCGKRDR